MGVWSDWLPLVWCSEGLCGLRAVAPGDTGVVSLGLCAAHGQALPVWAQHILCATDSDHACFAFGALLEGLWSLVLALLLPSLYPWPGQ